MKYSSLRYVGLAAILALVYLAAAELGLSLAFDHANVSPVWPPTGIAIASLLIFGRRYCPAIFVGALVANLLTPVSIPTAVGIAIGNTLEALVAASLLIRTIGRRPSLDVLGKVLRFVLYAVVLSTLISATIGTLSLCFGSAARWEDFGRLWITWWLGDGFGALVLTPFVLAWGMESRWSWSSKSLAEAAMLLAMLFITTMLILGGWFPGPIKDYPLAHLSVPYLVWAALRFDQRVLTTAIVILSGITVWGTVNGFGPFVHGGVNQSLLLLQAFIASSTLTSLILFAVISERKRAESEKLTLSAAVQAQRRRVEELVAHVPGVVWEAWGKPDEATQRIDFVSNYVEKMLGYSVKEWLSTPNFWLAVVHPDDIERAGREAAEIFSSGKGGTSRFRWMTKDGREVWVEAQSVVVCDDRGQPLGMRGVTMDITPAVLAEQERTALLRREREARSAAEDANRLKDEFLATVSHELRTPLNAIVGWSRLLRAGQLEKDGLTHAFEVIERNAWTQKQIIEDMLDVSRIITGKLRIGLKPVDLVPVIYAAIDVVRPGADAKGIRIEVRVDSPDLQVNADPERLQQVAWNLLSNAVKFSAPDGLVEVDVKRTDGRVQIEVADDGPGIPIDFLPHVFERFSQADSSSTRRHGGLGLGLAIARHLVELHGGTARAENRQNGRGAVVTVTLPVSEARTSKSPIQTDRVKTLS